MMEISEKTERLFWAKVNKSTGLGPWGNCWEWMATKLQGGYGQFKVNNKSWLAHRLSLSLVVDSPLASGMQACHKCDNPSCVNPDHLFAGTAQDNVNDKIAKGRARYGLNQNARKTHCIRGHEFTPENTLPGNGGNRHCRECHNQTRRERRALCKSNSQVTELI